MGLLRLLLHCLEQAVTGVVRATRVLKEPLLADLMAEPTRPPLPLSQGWERGRVGTRGLAPLCWVAAAPALEAQPVFPSSPQAH